LKLFIAYKIRCKSRY